MPGFEVIGHEEFEQVKHVFDESKILFRHSFDNLRNGVYKVLDFEQAFAKKMQVSEALAVTSGTAALRVALAALQVGRDDEVITQAFTFVATAEAIIEAGAVPIITEVDETLNMSPEDLEAKITTNTKAIIVVHMLGVPAQMDRIMQIAERHNLPVIEDTAWGCGGRYRGKHLGTIGTIGTFSFDFAKTLTTGEGGMVLSNNHELMEKARAWHDHGHENNPKLPRWEDSRSGSGFNYRMMELQGAVGLAQLAKLDSIIERQRANKRAIASTIADIAGLSFRNVPEGSEETADACIFFVKDNATARKCRESLLQAGVGTKILPEAITWHFAGTWDHMPTLEAANGSDLSRAFPKSKSLLDRAVALPIMVNMDRQVPHKVYKALEPILS